LRHLFGGARNPGKVRRCVEGHNRLHARGKIFTERGRSRQLPTGRLADQRDSIRVDPVLRRMRLHEPDGRLDVLDAGAELRHVIHQPVTDRKPGEAGIRERLQQRRHVSRTLPPNPSPAMHDDYGRACLGSLRETGVEGESCVAHSNRLSFSGSEL
jgi:hypothetical protein